MADRGPLPPLSAAGDDQGASCWQGWFDGGAAPNPGRIGIGGILLSPDGDRQHWSMAGGRTGCNNEAELLALIALLERAGRAGAGRLRVYGDSDFALCAGRACQRGNAQITVVARLQALLPGLAGALQGVAAVELVWIPRHRNGEADRLARQALGLPAKPAVLPGRTGKNRKRGKK